MKSGWIIAVIIALGLIAIVSNERGNGFSFSINSPIDLGIDRSRTGGTEESLEQNFDVNRDGVVTQEEREKGLLELAQRELKQIEKEVEKAQEAKIASVYKDKITLSRGTAGVRDRNDEYIIIRARGGNEENIKVTGWRIESPVTGRSFKIGEASIIPRNNEVNETDPIALAPGDTLFVATGFSPLGAPFRVNECSGYFSEKQSFSPRLSRECPALEDENLSALGIRRGAFRELEDYDACLEYIEDLNRCEIGDTDDELEDICNEVIERYTNYNGCVDLHKNDPEFLSGEWRYFLRRVEPAWRREREVIKLVDNFGKVVDFVSY